MGKETKHSLNVIRETDPSNPKTATSTPPAASPPEELSAPLPEPVKKPAFDLPDGYLLAQEMRALFNEDIVTHVQGESEPEAD